MPERCAKDRSSIRGWRLFWLGAFVGLLFISGLIIISPPGDGVTPALILHVLTPMGISGFVAVLLSEYVRKRIVSGWGRYTFSAVVGIFCGPLIILIMTASIKDIPAAAFYLAAWAGMVVGMAIRLALDEVISRKRSGDD